MWPLQMVTAAGRRSLAGSHTARNTETCSVRTIIKVSPQLTKFKTAIVKSKAETTAWCSHCQFITFITFLFTVNVIRQMALLFSKVDSNKLRRDVQNEQTVSCAKFGKDLFNISKVIGRKTQVAPVFWP